VFVLAHRRLTLSCDMTKRPVNHDPARFTQNKL
jgi:hypothetical protein